MLSQSQARRNLPAVRLNAFHMNSQSGSVRLVHFGNRAISLEQFGGPSSFVLQADGQDGPERDQVRDAMCYLAPEQTGGYESTTEDHRTDLYSLGMCRIVGRALTYCIFQGIVFWMTLVGGTALPFEAGPSELLHSIVQNRPRPVHEIRRDIPQVISAIIEKLLSKLPEARYNSAAGLQADLVECQKRLSATVCSESLTDATNEVLFILAHSQGQF
jgi:serine/threonine protein kinase